MPVFSDNQIESGLIEFFPVIASDPKLLQAIPNWVRNSFARIPKHPDTWFGICPFCRHKKFYVQDGRYWECTACERHGNVIDFYRTMDGLNHTTTLRVLVYKCITEGLL